MFGDIKCSCVEKKGKKMLGGGGDFSSKNGDQANSIYYELISSSLMIMIAYSTISSNLNLIFVAESLF